MTSYLILAVVLLVSVLPNPSAGQPPEEPTAGGSAETWTPKGDYRFTGWDGPELGVFYTIPPNANPLTPILIVIPGARRNADEYRDEWDKLAVVGDFIVLTLEGSREDFPSELEYNAGGVMSAGGELQPESQWLYSAIEPLFDDFVKRFGSQRKSYSLYGHSAGGGFVQRYMLLKPNARVVRAVAANPAFCTMPHHEATYPFGLEGLKLSDNEIRAWLAKPMCIMLGALDRGPRTKPLSNGPEALKQGPNVFSRGLLFYHRALVTSRQLDAPLNWKLSIVDNVGHSNAHVASHAVAYLFPH